MIITFDAGLAVFLVISMIIMSSFYITRGDREVFPKIQVMRNMQDIIVALHNNGTLETLDLNLIETLTADSLGPAYNFSYLIEKYNSSYVNTLNFTIRTPTEKNTFVSTGYYMFPSWNGVLYDYYEINYGVWER